MLKICGELHRWYSLLVKLIAQKYRYILTSVYILIGVFNALCAFVDLLNVFSSNLVHTCLGIKTEYLENEHEHNFQTIILVNNLLLIVMFISTYFCQTVFAFFILTTP